MRYINHAVESGARMVCFPQLFFLPWFLREENATSFELAVAVDDDILGSFQEVARKREVVLVCPFFEKRESDYFSSAIVIDSDGSLAGVYRKTHIPDIPDWKEKFYFSPGDDGFEVIETACGKIGVQLCWDNFFPEGSRVLALKGAEIIFAPTAAAYASQQRWLHVVSANAFVNNLFIFRVNRVGADHGLDFYGESFCVDPYGELIAGPVDMKESIILADLDFDKITEAREQTGFIRDRRNALYEGLFRGEVKRER